MTLNRKYPDHPDGGQNDTACRPAHAHGVHMIVASEPTTYKLKEWTLMEKNHAMLVSSDGTYQIEAIDTPSELLATAPTTQHG